MDKETMYTLGQICRCIWPGGKNYQDNPPASIFDLVLTRPASGLAMMIKSQANTKAKQDDIGDLVDKLDGRLCDPDGGVPAEIQGAFWIGYYHYASAIAASKAYGADELGAIGEALYGNQWQTDMSRALGLSDARRIRQWLKGDRAIPTGIWAELASLLRQRQMAIKDVLSDLTQD